MTKINVTLPSFKGPSKIYTSKNPTLLPILDKIKPNFAKAYTETIIGMNRIQTKKEIASSGANLKKAIGMNLTGNWASVAGVWTKIMG